MTEDTRDQKGATASSASEDPPVRMPILSAATWPASFSYLSISEYRPYLLSNAEIACRLPCFWVAQEELLQN